MRELSDIIGTDATTVGPRLTSLEGAVTELTFKDYTSLKNSSLSPADVQVGHIIRTLAEGFAYKVMPPGTAQSATGYHIDTTGGLLLQVCARAGGTPIEAFGAPAGPVPSTYSDSTAIIQMAFDWSALDRRNIVLMDGDYAISATITKQANAQIISTRRSVIRPYSGSTVSPSIRFLPGNHIGRTSLPTHAGFVDVCVEIQGDLANVYVAQFNGCGTAWKVVAGDLGLTALDCELEFDGISACTTAVQVHVAVITGTLVQGLRVKGNFITGTKNGLIRTGVASYDDGMVFDILAMDVTASKAGGAIFDNQATGGHVPARLNATIRSWLGGVGFSDASNPTQVFKGIWASAVVDLCNAVNFTNAMQTPNLVRGSNIRLRGGMSNAEAIDMGDPAAGLAGFNGGVMLSKTDMTLKVTTPVSVAVGQTFSRLFYHVWGDANYGMFVANMGRGSSGLIVSMVDDQGRINPGQVSISFTNLSSAAIAAGTVFYVDVHRR